MLGPIKPGALGGCSVYPPSANYGYNDNKNKNAPHNKMSR